MAITKCKASPVWINTCAWPSPNWLIARACATSKVACEPINPSSGTWVSRAHLAQHLGPCQRTPRLAHLGRFRPGLDPRGPRTLPQRQLRGGVGRDRLCLRLHHHQPLPLALSLGAISEDQSRSQAPYPARPARQHPRLDPRDPGRGPRRQRPGSASARTRSLLHLRPRLSRFHPALHPDSSLRLFITRAKRNTRYRRRYSRPVDKSTGLRCDQTVVLTNYYAHPTIPRSCA